LGGCAVPLNPKGFLIPSNPVKHPDDLMAKRFTATDIWDEDWFLDMPCGYKLFWFYMLSTCDHAGLFKVNLRSFCGLNGVKIEPEQALEYFNSGKNRLRVVNQSLWLIEDFFVYQYGHTFNPNNKVHASIESLYLKHGIKMTSIRGLTDLKERVKDKDKDKDKDSITVNGKKIKKIKGERVDVQNWELIFEDGSSRPMDENEVFAYKKKQFYPEQEYKPCTSIN
jgi:hypothetical protein